MRKGFSLGALALVVGLLIIAATTALGRPVRAHTAAKSPCTDPFPGTRDASNPLMLATPPGANPLNGAPLFTDGPAHGLAAGAIAQLLGLNPKNFADDFSWAQFASSLSTGSLAAKLTGNAGLLHEITELEKIASEPDPNRFSAFSQGGSPQGVFAQVKKIFCSNLTADPGAIPTITTYFMHPDFPGCPTPAVMRRNTSKFRSQIDAMASATGNRPAIYMLELDAIGSSRCIQRAGSLKLWEQNLKYEVTKIGSLPHTVVYLEAGYSDGNPPGYTAKVLNASGVRMIRGFFTNDTHNAWTINEIKWGEKVSKKAHGANFVIDTAQNGNGPKRNPHPTKQGNEALCNPPGRVLGPQPTTNTGFPHVDAFLWTHVPAISAGPCNGGPPPSTFWVARGVQMAEGANGRLGPGLPSKPY